MSNFYYFFLSTGTLLASKGTQLICLREYKISCVLATLKSPHAHRYSLCLLPISPLHLICCGNEKKLISLFYTFFLVKTIFTFCSHFSVNFFAFSLHIFILYIHILIIFMDIFQYIFTTFYLTI